jgi:hypothetical protein
MMLPGALDRHTLIDTSELGGEIAALMAEIQTEEPEKRLEFFHYFEEIWMKRFDVASWNISVASKDDFKIYSRKNNALENFNCKLNSRFTTPHPNIFRFIDVIRGLSQETAKLYYRCRRSCTDKIIVRISSQDDETLASRPVRAKTTP